MGLTVKNVCKLINTLRPDVDITVAGEFGEGINDRAWCYSSIYDSKPPNFENLVTKDKEVTAIEIVSGPELNDESVTVCFDMSKKEEKMEKMEQKHDKEPVKLSSVLELFNLEKDECIKLCIKLKTGKYVYLRGDRKTLCELDIVQGCFIDGISTLDRNTDEEILYIQATKQVSIEPMLSMSITRNPPKLEDDDLRRLEITYSGNKGG